MSIITLDFTTHNYPNISRVDGLPFDSTAILACPASYGGVIIQTPNSILHVDQGSRITLLVLNTWATRVSSTASAQPLGGSEDPSSLNLTLEGAKISFVDEKNLLLCLSNGVVHVISVVVDGRSVSRLVINDAIAQCSPPSILVPIAEDHIFVGCMVGPSVLLQSSWHKPSIDAAAPEEKENQIEVDQDEDDIDAGWYLQNSATGQTDYINH